MADRSLEFLALVASLSAETVTKSVSSAAGKDTHYSSASAASASSQNGASSRSAVSKAVSDSFSTAARAAFVPVRAALARIATSSATRHAYLAIAAEEAPSSALAAGFGASAFSGASFPTALPSATAMSDDQRIRFEEDILVVVRAAQTQVEVLREEADRTPLSSRSSSSLSAASNVVSSVFGLFGASGGSRDGAKTGTESADGTDGAQRPGAEHVDSHDGTGSLGDDLRRHRQAIVLLLMRSVAQLTDRMKALREARAQRLRRFERTLKSRAFESALERARNTSVDALQSRRQNLASLSADATSPATLVAPEPAFAPALAQSSTSTGAATITSSLPLFSSPPVSAASSKATSTLLVAPAVSSVSSVSSCLLASSSSASVQSSSTPSLLPSSLRNRFATPSAALPSASASTSFDTLPPPFDAARAAEEEQFNQESQQMLHTFESELQSIRESEQKLAAISALMSDFSSKVLTQSETIESVFATTQQSTVHLERGQNELKEATEHSSSFRILILMFMLLIGFSMLFLDWYQ